MTTTCRTCRCEARPVDPAVGAAEQVRDQAQATFDELDAAWKQASRRRRAVEYDTDTPDAERQQLVDDERAALDRRNAAWPPLVRADGLADLAKRAAMLREQ